jgi:hypothetical protein
MLGSAAVAVWTDVWVCLLYMAGLCLAAAAAIFSFNWGCCVAAAAAELACLLMLPRRLHLCFQAVEAAAAVMSLADLCCACSGSIWLVLPGQRRSNMLLLCCVTNTAAVADSAAAAASNRPGGSTHCAECGLQGSVGTVHRIGMAGVCLQQAYACVWVCLWNAVVTV